MKELGKVIDTARADPRHIVLAEGEDPRIIQGALDAVGDGIARITLVGDTTKIRRQLSGQSRNAAKVDIEDPSVSPLVAQFAAAFFERHREKGVDEAAALGAMREPLQFAAMMVRENHADGTIGGAVATTAATVRAALQIIGPARGCGLVSSFFLMLLDQSHHSRQSIVVFADCGLVVEPDAEQLASIAVASAASFEALLGERAKVAMLSFSTFGSARHERVATVVEATNIVKVRVPSLTVAGEIQFDAAFVPEVSAIKSPDSVVQGQANVFIFPNLDAANIGYKIAQRIGGAKAVGPILQGLAKPANDLSRGCSAQDVYFMIAVTGVQAGQNVERE